MIYIGIDPGAKGSMCLINSGKLTFMDFDLRNYSNTLKAFCDTCDTELIVAVEKVHAMPGQGVSSSFSFGQRLGELEGMLVALQSPYELIAPKDCLKACGIPSKSDKKGIASVIQKLYPKAELYGNKGGLRDGRSDALGLAHFIRLKYGK